MTLTHYLKWRSASKRFGKRPWELSDEEAREIDAQSEREHRVITRALAAPVAGDVDAESDVVRAVIDEMASAYAERSLFARALLRGGLTEESLSEAIAMELRAGLILEQIGAAATVSESQVHAYYHRHRARMHLPERRTARHILITVNDDFEENRRENALRRLSEATSALAEAEEFSKVALRFSECPTAVDGGRLGEIRRGQLYPELDAVLFELTPGEIRAVTSPLGFHLLLCEAVIPEQPLSFETAAPSIRRRLEANAKHQLMQQWINVVEN